jgi:hypothetical protein
MPVYDAAANRSAAGREREVIVSECRQLIDGMHGKIREKLSGYTVPELKQIGDAYCREPYQRLMALLVLDSNDGAAMMAVHYYSEMLRQIEQTAAEAAAG